MNSIYGQVLGATWIDEHEPTYTCCKTTGEDWRSWDDENRLQGDTISSKRSALIYAVLMVEPR